MLIGTGLALNITRPAPFDDFAKPDVVALLRGPIPNPVVFRASRDWVRQGIWHEPGLVGIPVPSDASNDEFGMLQKGHFSVEIAEDAATRMIPTLHFDWINGEQFSDRVAGLVPTFVRAGATATRYKSTGIIDGPLAANTPRFDYDPVTLACKGIIFEEERTNLVPYSNTPSSWTQVLTPGPTQNLTGPDGVANSAWTLTDNDAAGYEGIQQNIAVANDSLTRTLSLHVRKNPGAANTFGLNIGYNVGTPVQATPRFNADTGAIANSGGLFATVAGWWGWQQQMTNNNSGNTNFYINVFPAPAVWPGADAMSAQGSHGIYGVQFEVGAFRTSYIPNPGAGTNTRGVETCYTDNIDWYNQRGGTVICEFWLGEDVQCGVWQIANPLATADFVELYANGGSFYARVWAGGVEQASIVVGGAVANTRHRVAFAFRENSFRVSVNGGAVNSALSGSMPAVTRAVWGQSLGGGLLNGHVSIWSYFSTDRSDDDLVKLSARTASTNAPAQLLLNRAVQFDRILRRRRTDGSVTDFIDERQGVVKALVRKRASTTLDVVDIDRAARKVLFPIGTYNTMDFPKLYVNHVGRAIAQGVGLCRWLECTFVDDTLFKYAVCEIRTGQAVPTIIAVYRGKEAGKGGVVDATEYAISTGVVGGRNFLFLTFTRPQTDFQNQPYVVGVKINAPGARTPAEEHAFISQAIGLTIDAADYADAAAYHVSAGIAVDAWWTKRAPADAALQQLELAGRFWCSQAIGGAYSLMVDRPRDVTRVLWDAANAITIEERRTPEVAKSVTLQYRPRVTGDYEGDLVKTTGGSAGEQVFRCDVIDDHAVASRLLDFLTKRAQRSVVRATVGGMELQPGELIAVNSPLVLDGWKSLAARVISRIAGGNSVEFYEYQDSDYTYSGGTVPVDAVNAYLPDYSYTKPIVPTGLNVTANAPTVDSSGKAFATLRVRATPPVSNWAKLMCRVKNNVTNELTAEQELVLSGGFYETTLGRLEPNVSHTTYCYAVNANNLSSDPVTETLNTSQYSSAPPTPTGLQGFQQAGDTLVFIVDNPNYAHHDRVEWEVKAGGAPFYVQPEASNRLVFPNVTYGANYQARARFKDKSGNYSAYTAFTASITPSRLINDSHVVSGGIGNGSMANNSINTAQLIGQSVVGSKIYVVSTINQLSGTWTNGDIIQLDADQGLWSTMSSTLFTCVGGGGPAYTRWRYDGSTGSYTFTAYENQWYT